MASDWRARDDVRANYTPFLHLWGTSDRGVPFLSDFEGKPPQKPDGRGRVVTERRLSSSAATLALIVDRSTAAHVARELQCDESAVRSWARGRRSPSPAWRDRLAAFDARLVVDGWSVDATPSEASHVPVKLMSAPTAPAHRTPRPPQVPSTDATVGEERLLEVIRQCDELYAEAAKPDAHASVRDRTAILATKASATVRLSKVRGEDVVSMRKILESKHWREIKQVLFDVFSKAPKEFLDELVERLEALEAAEGRS